MGDNSKGTHVGRRDFIKATAFASMVAAIPAAGYTAQGATGGSKPSPAGNKRNVCVVTDEPERYTKTIESIKSIKEFEFQVSPVKADFRKPEEVAKIIKEQDADAYVMFMPGIGVTSGRFAEYLDDLQAPLIMLPPILSLIMLEADVVANLRRKNIPALLANSESNLLELLKIVSAPRILEGKKALIFGKPFDSTSVPAHNLDADYVYRHTGVKLEYRPISDLKLMLENVDEAKAREEMERWKKGAVKIVEPNDESILKASRMYVLLKSIIEKDNLDGLSIDCLSFSFDQNPILPLPCLAYVRLRDEGYAAPCEADVCMMLTSMLLQEISRKSFFHFNVSSIDQEKSITSLRHCVAPTKLFGDEAPPLPYKLRDYHGFGRDVVPEVEFPAGTEVTIGGFSKDLKDFVLWPGRIVPGVHDMETPSFDNVPENAPASMKNMRRFCSNKADVKIHNADRFLHSIAGIHNVFVAGSYSKTIYDALMRMNVNVIAPPDLNAPEA